MKKSAKSVTKTTKNKKSSHVQKKTVTKKQVTKSSWKSLLTFSWGKAVVFGIVVVLIAFFAGFSGYGPVASVFDKPTIMKIQEEDPSLARSNAEREAITRLNKAAQREARISKNEDSSKKEQALVDVLIAGQVLEVVRENNVKEVGDIDKEGGVKDIALTQLKGDTPFANDHGEKILIENDKGQLVFNPNAAESAIGASLKSSVTKIKDPCLKACDFMGNGSASKCTKCRQDKPVRACCELDKGTPQCGTGTRMIYKGYAYGTSCNKAIRGTQDCSNYYKPLIATVGEEPKCAIGGTGGGSGSSGGEFYGCTDYYNSGNVYESSTGSCKAGEDADPHTLYNCPSLTMKPSITDKAKRALCKLQDKNPRRVTCCLTQQYKNEQSGEDILGSFGDVVQENTNVRYSLSQLKISCQRTCDPGSLGVDFYVPVGAEKKVIGKYPCDFIEVDQASMRQVRIPAGGVVCASVR